MRLLWKDIKAIKQHFSIILVDSSITYPYWQNKSKSWQNAVSYMSNSGSYWNRAYIWEASNLPDVQFCILPTNYSNWWRHLLVTGAINCHQKSSQICELAWNSSALENMPSIILPLSNSACCSPIWCMQVMWIWKYVTAASTQNTLIWLTSSLQ